MNLQDICIPKDSKYGEHQAPLLYSTTESFDNILSSSVLPHKQSSSSNVNGESSLRVNGHNNQIQGDSVEDVREINTVTQASQSEGKVSVVTPFLVKHISDQSMIPKDNFHRYCYRHNPDVTCNKQTDEVKMKNIQKQMEKLPSRDQEAINHVWSIFSAAPDPHRSLILQGLLSQCCFPQLSFISQEVSSLIKIDFISTLPMEISLKILCYLDCASLCNAAQVSRKWKCLADDDRVWHHMCEQHIDRKCPNCGWGLPLMHMQRARHMNNDEHNSKKRKLETVEPSNGSNSSEVELEIKKMKVTQDEQDKQRKLLKKRPWKSVYSERFKLEKNWRKGIYKIKTFEGHTDGVTCLQFNRKYLMTGSYDNTVKIWKVETGECLRTLTGHTKPIRSCSNQ